MSIAPIENFKYLYSSFNKQSLLALGDIYSDSVTFTDPIHSVKGLPQLTQYFQSMCANLTACNFEFIRELVGENEAFFKWKMHYRHPSIKSNAPLNLVGSSFITFSEKIDSHEDFYDMGAMLYEHIPLLGGTVRMVKARAAKV